MPVSDIPQDFSPKSGALRGSISAAGVPRYILYGDAGARADWFVNVEHLDHRCRERGWVITPHTHPRFTQIVICTTGGGEITIEGETHLFSRDCAMVIPSYCIHGFRYADDTAGWVLTIENDYLADLLVRAPALKLVFGEPGVVPLDPAALPRIDAEFINLAAELHEQRNGCAIGSEIHLLAILLVLLRQWPIRTTGSAAGGVRQVLVDRFKTIVEDRYRTHPALPAIADELHVSVSQLRLACKTVTGVSPIAILHDRILAEAKRCLAYTTMPIGTLADWLGFSDVAYFSRFFVKTTGVTPTAFRRAQQFRG